MNYDRFKWIRKPVDFKIEPDRIEITTEPHTDLWQRTYYHFRNDNAPVFQMETEDKFFSFVVKTEFSESHHRFDQCGIVMYLDSENWLKGSIEYENETFQHLGSVVTNHGYSDWATTEIPADVKTMWYRFSRREDDYCIECSKDGKTFSQMRVCHMWEGGGTIRFGVYAFPRGVSERSESSITVELPRGLEAREGHGYYNHPYSDSVADTVNRFEQLGLVLYLLV